MWTVNKIFTKQKLTYGFSLTYAYCGVPNIYVRKKEAIIACLAPLVIFSIIFFSTRKFKVHERGAIFVLCLTLSP